MHVCLATGVQVEAIRNGSREVRLSLPPLPALSATLTHSLSHSLSLPARLAAVLRERVVQHQDLPGRARGSVSRAQLHRRGTRTYIRTHAHACVAVLTLCLQELSAVGQASAGIEGRSDQQHSHCVPMSAFLSDKAAEAALKKGTYVPEHLHKSPIRPGPVSSVFLSVPLLCPQGSCCPPSALARRTEQSSSTSSRTATSCSCRTGQGERGPGQARDGPP